MKRGWPIYFCRLLTIKLHDLQVWGGKRRLKFRGILAQGQQDAIFIHFVAANCAFGKPAQQGAVLICDQ